MESKEQILDEGQGSRWRLYFAVLSVNFLFICDGTFAAWLSPTMEALSTVLTSNELSLVGSLYSFGAAFGPVISAFLLDRVGRKGTLYFLGSCFIIAWVVLASSWNAYVLYIGRIIGGVGVGGSFSSGSLFVAEIADVRSRGTVGSLIMFSVSFGILMEYCIGPWSSYYTLIIVSVIPVILFFLTFFFIPESPFYLLLRERKSEATESLRWYRGNIDPERVQKELLEMEESIIEAKNNQASFKALFRRGPALGLLIGIYVLILQQGTGNNAIINYNQYIFTLSGVSIPSKICPIIGGLATFLSGFFTPFIVHRYSMKRTLLFSTYIVALALGVISLFFYLKSSGRDVSSLSFLPILAYVVYNIAMSWGSGPLPWAITSELSPIEVKSIFTCICGVISSLVGFATIEITGIMIPSVGPAVVFAGYFIFVLVFNTIGFFLIPETSGMSLPEVHHYLATGLRPQKPGYIPTSFGIKLVTLKQLSSSLSRNVVTTYMECENVTIKKRGSRIRLFLATASVNFLYVCLGSVTAWTSPTLPKLANILSNDQASLVGSLYSFGSAFGPIISAFTLDTIGRKGTLYILGGCFLISWIVLASSFNVYVLYVGRVIGGIGVGGTFSSAALFLAEVADKRSRGAIGSINQTSVALGCLIEYCIGPWTGYLTLVLISAIPVILFFVTFYFVPESPYYLLIKERKSDAVESLRWFRGNIDANSVQQELGEIQESIRMKSESRDGYRLIIRKGPLKSLLICFYLLSVEQGSGNTAILSFAQKIFEKARVEISGAMIAIIGSITIFFAGLVAPYIVSRFSMKTAFLISSFGVALSLGLLSLYFYLDSIGQAVSYISFLPVLAFVLYKLFFCWGCGSLPWAISAEMFPLKIKGLATSLCGIYYSMVGFAVIEMTGIYLESSGPTTVFSGLFFFVLVTTVGVVFLLPDTSGLSLQEIHHFMETGKRPARTDS